jgi:hypothetical protein
VTPLLKNIGSRILKYRVSFSVTERHERLKVPGCNAMAQKAGLNASSKICDVLAVV